MESLPSSLKTVVYEDLHEVFVKKSTDFSMHRKGTLKILDFLPKDWDPSTEELVTSGAVWHFFIALDQHKQLLELKANEALAKDDFESSALLKETDRGGMKKLVTLYKSSRDQIKQKALSIFGDIAGDSSELCDFQLVRDQFFMALSLLIETANIDLVRTVSRTLYAFCAFLDPDFTQKSRIYHITETLLQSNDVCVLKNACWALANTPCYTYDETQEVIGSRICPRLANLLIRHDASVFVPVLLTLYKVSTGTFEQNQYLIDLDVLPMLKGLLNKDNKDRVLKLACCFIANVSSCDAKFAKAVIEADLVPRLINLLEGETYCKVDALLSILNCATYASPEQFNNLFDEGCLKPICDLLISENAVIIKFCLALLEEILSRRGADIDAYKKIIEGVGGLDNIRIIKFRKGEPIFKGAAMLLQKYWIKEEYELVGLETQV